MTCIKNESPLKNRGIRVQICILHSKHNLDSLVDRAYMTGKVQPVRTSVDVVLVMTESFATM